MLHQKTLDIPHLPNEKVKTVITDARNKSLVKALNELGIEVIATEKVKEFLPFEKFHADMQMLNINTNTVFVLEQCRFLINELQKLFKNVILIPLNRDVCCYPNNIMLNIAIIGKNALCKVKAVNKIVLDTLTRLNFNVINVNQGYSKCSTAIVNKNAIITSDPSIYKAAVKNKIDVLKITEGYIELKGTGHGFIGGCCGKISDDMLAFSGNISKHKDYDNIKVFCKNYNVDIISLTNENLSDVGGIIPILEG